MQIDYYNKYDRMVVSRFQNTFLLILFVLWDVRMMYSYDCNIGCALDISVNGDIVCGEDNIDYPNECFALCQGVPVIRTGSCTTSDKNNENTAVMERDTSINISSVISTGLIPINVMKKYQNDGYNFVRQWDYNKLNGKVRKPSITIDPNNKFTESSLLKQQRPQIYLYKPCMITSEGYEYIGKEIMYNMSNVVPGTLTRSVGSYDPYNDSDINNMDRLLKVIGTDSRIQVMNTTTIPFSFIGALGYNPDNIICSGTVIYKSAVLTAAHCVFDTNTQQWIQHKYFAPGRGHDGISANDPYGQWDVDTIQIFNSYKPDWHRFGLDVAVITYKPNNNSQLIGDVVGYAGLEEVTGYDDPNLDQSNVTGYPGDKGGRTMWTMGLCPSGFVSGKLYGFDARIALHDCDITCGTIGSSFMMIGYVNNHNYKVHGVSNFEIRTSYIPWNGGNVFFQGNGLYDSILYLSGRSSTPVLEPDTLVPVPETPVPRTPAPETPSLEPETPFPCPELETPVPETEPPVQDYIFCFSTANTVEVLDVGEISISQLKIGDYVKGKDHMFTRVYSLGHWNHNIESSFLQIYLDDKLLPLEISSKHFVFVERWDNSTTPEYDQTPQQITIPACDVIIGDILSGRQVASINHIICRGIYAPLTETGDIVVSQILASNYVHLIDSSWIIWNQHTIGHIVWFPYRCFCRYYINVCMNESYTKDGYTLYASWIIQLSSIINEVGWLFHLIISLLFIPIIATIVWVIESSTTTTIIIISFLTFAKYSYHNETSEKIIMNKHKFRKSEILLF